MTQAKWMIYGATGYTGKLIAQESARRGQKPILAGRGEAIESLSRGLGLESRRFPLDSPAEVSRALESVKLVLHCAGPFSATSLPMLEGCLRARAHYLDITGEVSVFESIFGRSGEFKSAGIAAIPGVGFDVVPTDALSRMLQERLPDANRLRLAFKGGRGISIGTLKTMIENLAEPALARKDGRLVRMPLGSKSIQVPFDRDPELALLIPWGDVSTAYFTTGIPDIEVYSAGTRATAIGMKIAPKLGAFAPVRSALKRVAERFVSGPTDEQRASGRIYIWCDVRNAAGKSVSLRMITPEGYRFTVHSSLAAVERVLAQSSLTGALTPTQAFGVDFVQGLPEVEILAGVTA